jgi:large subunit ribosomal protein L5
MQSDYLEKIIVSIGVGKIRLTSPQFEEKVLPEIMKELAAITGQKPAITKAKKSIAGFKVRQGEVVGLKVILRRKRMKDFLSRIVNVVLPRVRDFRGLNVKSIDQNGNISFGFKDQLVFPEINAETSRTNFGIEVTLVAHLKNKEKAIDFYRSQGIPLAK